ncbi:MAG: hypothetical protein CV087_10000 [Candidatus Brocadia sp. WS118]|nr:MAG: hypothetical protein CV087_10000 [Candidatus Brocadia sp. WS118]
MQNWAYLNRSELSKNNYVRIASPKNNYWLDFYFNRISYYQKKYGDDFSIIIIGDIDKETDFYAIPFREVKDLFVIGTLAHDSRNALRWTAKIINHRFEVYKTGVKKDINPFYGNGEYLITIAQDLEEFYTDEDKENEYAIHNRKIEINGRLKQSLFRRMVLKNFEYRCCLTEIREENLLIASHIIPWSSRITTRLDPSNGLCLFSLYDSFFDKGYISFDDDLRVVTLSNTKSLSTPLKEMVELIRGKAIRKPVNYNIKLEYIQYHRLNIFVG